MRHCGHNIVLASLAVLLIGDSRAGLTTVSIKDYAKTDYLAKPLTEGDLRLK